MEITLLALPGDSRGADHRGRISLEFRRQHLDGMAKPYFDLTSVIQSCDTIGRRGPQRILGTPEQAYQMLFDFA